MSKLLEVAKTQIGVEEIPRGSNWGKDVQKYLASVGINFPASWCMAFVYWCSEEANIRIPDKTGGLSNPLQKTGGVLKQWNELEYRTVPLYGKYLQFKFYTPKPGDIFIQDHGKGLGHTGIVESVEGELIQTIEGNTNDEGSREGFEVCRKTRKISSCVGFIRIEPA